MLQITVYLNGYRLAGGSAGIQLYGVCFDKLILHEIVYVLAAWDLQHISLCIHAGLDLAVQPECIPEQHEYACSHSGLGTVCSVGV